MDPNAPEATSITVDEPLSDIRGAGVQIEPGSLIGTGRGVGQHLRPRQRPRAALGGGAQGEAPRDLKPVELGPSGTAFRKGARVQLPVSAEVLKRGRPAVITIDPVSGAWEKVKFLAVDEAQGIVTAEIEHFSTYVVAPDADLLELQALARGGRHRLRAAASSSAPPWPSRRASCPPPSSTVSRVTAADLAGVLAALSSRTRRCRSSST